MLINIQIDILNFRKNINMPARTDEILKGFRVNWVNLRDNDSGKIPQCIVGRQIHVNEHANVPVFHPPKAMRNVFN